MGFAIGGPSKGPELEDVDNRAIALAAGRALVQAADDRTTVADTDTEAIINAIHDVGAAICAAVILAEHWAAERGKS